MFGPFGGRKGDDWGAISAWAWGASRVMDWIEKEPLIDSKHVGVVGHSRGGNAVCGALERDITAAVTITHSDRVSTTFTVSNPTPAERRALLDRQREDLERIGAMD